jgi:hypothetical protein
MNTQDIVGTVGLIVSMIFLAIAGWITLNAEEEHWAASMGEEQFLYYTCDFGDRVTLSRGGRVAIYNSEVVLDWDRVIEDPRKSFGARRSIPGYRLSFSQFHEDTLRSATWRYGAIGNTIPLGDCYLVEKETN